VEHSGGSSAPPRKMRGGTAKVARRWIVDTAGCDKVARQQGRLFNVGVEHQSRAEREKVEGGGLKLFWGNQRDMNPRQQAEDHHGEPGHGEPDQADQPSHQPGCQIHSSLSYHSPLALFH